MLLKSFWVEDVLKYDGTQLSSLFAYRNFRVQGDSIVAFRGGCQVELRELVDVEDVLDQAHIYSEDMLHFIIEHFDQDLEKMVLRQRLFIAIISELLQAEGVRGLTRTGDDLFQGAGKLSVSIATLTRVSTMIHTGLNISSKHTPVKTISLQELGILDPRGFAGKVMNAYAAEIEGIRMARCKVRGVD
ncbi:MAG: DUF366 family protein [Clostridia bacterium]|nr:DUF366 family protein [Clostridia bacterium]